LAHQSVRFNLLLVKEEEITLAKKTLLEIFEIHLRGGGAAAPDSKRLLLRVDDGSRPSGGWNRAS
jgi:hypothetical protein